MILFLDFDGVLHPQYDGAWVPPGQAFCHLPRLEAVLRDFPSVDLVISSEWRRQFPLDVLRARFSPDIAVRIVGATPAVASAPAGHYVPARREAEILQWLGSAGRSADGSWLALDDAVWQFDRYRDRIVACSARTGFDGAVEAVLRQQLGGWARDGLCL